MPKGVYIRTEETKRKIGEARKGIHLSEETKRRLSEALRGKVRSKEHCLHISKTLTGRTLSSECVEKIRRANTGKHRTDEFRRRMSFFMKGKTPNNKGKKMSNEQREKIRQSHIRRWDKIGRKQGRPQHDKWEYTNWKLKVFQRDGFACMVCGIVGGKLEAHHIKPFALFPESRHETDNGITLCKVCHSNLHYKYGRKSITPKNV